LAAFVQEVAEPWSTGVDSMLNLVLLIDGATMASMTQREQGIFQVCICINMHTHTHTHTKYVAHECVVIVVLKKKRNEQ
jgi:hypothetical protein